MSDNFREFDLEVQTYSRLEVPKQVKDFRDALALEGLRGLVNLTPVDTGRLRGNWQTTVGSPAEGDTESVDKSGGSTIAAGVAVVAQATDPFAPIWLHNGVEYSEFVNDGTAKVPAVHMLERTVARLRRIARSRR